MCKGVKETYYKTPDLSTHACTCKSGPTEINKGSKPRLSHVVQRFSRLLS